MIRLNPKECRVRIGVARAGRELAAPDPVDGLRGGERWRCTEERRRRSKALRGVPRPDACARAAPAPTGTRASGAARRCCASTAPAARWCGASAGASGTGRSRCLSARFGRRGLPSGRPRMPLPSCSLRALRGGGSGLRHRGRSRGSQDALALVRRSLPPLFSFGWEFARIRARIHRRVHIFSTRSTT